MISNQQSFSTDPNVLGGVPTFVGTRVPVSAMIDYLSAGQTIDEFLEDFPTVTHEQALSVLSFMQHSALHAHPR
ncbi:MAG: DUF433 domain-containing protein [Alphaproteobacteria bacterium]|nr:DUF433 domain-containing protein [Alphaproteobacteria bacterium]